MKYKTIVGAMAFASLLGSGCAFAALDIGPGTTPFYIDLYNQQQADRQVARLVGDHSMVVAIRIPDVDRQGADARAIVAKFKHESPQSPVLMYAWATRNLTGKQGSVGVMDWLTDHSELQVRTPGGRAMQSFGDVSSSDYRSRVASSIAAAVERGGYDGVAFDLVVRTPRYRPVPLAAVCAAESSFCARYAEGVDATLDATRQALGKRAVFYNGIWNLGPGSVEDGASLLNHADAAMVEFFGGEVRTGRQTFTDDVLPYLQAISKAPEGKPIFVYGRGAIQYNDYAEDYARQRYLDCAYLLGAGKNTFFKYLATFGSTVLKGRSGAFSLYADAFANIGAPTKAYSVESGLYSRPFAHGLVILAPDDGHGGSYSLPNAMYSMEGQKFEGKVNLQPGEALLLLDAKQANVKDQHLLDLKLLSDWPKSSPFTDGQVSGLALQDGAPQGSHDMLLDVLRTPRPSNVLQLQTMVSEPSTRIQIQAEVDDSARHTMFAILDLGIQGSPNAASGGEKMEFRVPVANSPGKPVIEGPALVPGKWQTLALNGHDLFASSGLTFRRWDYVRFNGALKLASVKLSD